MRKKRRRILLITDLDIMPKLSGSKLVKKLRAARMALPVIRVSGTMTPQKLNRNRWRQLSGAPYGLPPPLGSLLQRLRLDCFRSSTDPPSVISEEVFALLSLAPIMQRADYERA